MKDHKYKLATLVLSTGLLLGACGGDDTAEAPEEQSDDTTVEELKIQLRRKKVQKALKKHLTILRKKKLQVMLQIQKDRLKITRQMEQAALMMVKQIQLKMTAVLLMKAANPLTAQVLQYLISLDPHLKMPFQQHRKTLTVNL